MTMEMSEHETTRIIKTRKRNPNGKSNWFSHMAVTMKNKSRMAPNGRTPATNELRVENYFHPKQDRAI